MDCACAIVCIMLHFTNFHCWLFELKITTHQALLMHAMHAEYIMIFLCLFVLNSIVLSTCRPIMADSRRGAPPPHIDCKFCTKINYLCLKLKNGSAQLFPQSHPYLSALYISKFWIRHCTYMRAARPCMSEKRCICRRRSQGGAEIANLTTRHQICT